MGKQVIKRSALSALGVSAFCLSPTLLSSCSAQTSSPAAAVYKLIEAESDARGEIRLDRAALGGKYVHVTGNYQPLLFADLPKTGDSFTVWARVRGAATQLKGIAAGGAQKELKWSYGKPSSFEWVCYGRYDRTVLGSRVLVIQGAGGDTASGIDALVLASDPAFDPNAALSTVITSPVMVTVDWAKSAGTPATRFSYALNLYRGTDEKNARSAEYRANLEYMDPGIVRIHNAGKMRDSKKTREGIIDEAKHDWDRAKIKQILPLQLNQRPAVLMNIPGWPDWMDADKDGFLDRDQFDNYAKMMADLVRIVNVENRCRVRYWEITNELDGRYFTNFYAGGGSGSLKDAARPDRWDEVIEIYNKCAAAMKKVDPTIQTGGPAAARPDLHSMHERFIRGTLTNLDFFSMHAYASGNAGDSDSSVYDKAPLMGRFSHEVVEMLKRLSPDRAIPMMLGEYNISWTWQTRDPRMTNHKSGVFDALVMVSTAEAGAFSAQAWNEKDGIYGKTDDADKRRPGADVLHLFNTYLVGNRAVTTTSDEKAVVGYAVVDVTKRRRSLLLINRTSTLQTVSATLSGGTPPPETITRNQIAADGMTAKTEAMPKSGVGEWKLPPDSITLLVF